jgi:hypothetical protein
MPPQGGSGSSPGGGLVDRSTPGEGTAPGPAESPPIPRKPIATPETIARELLKKTREGRISEQNLRDLGIEPGRLVEYVSAANARASSAPSEPPPGNAAARSDGVPHGEKRQEVRNGTDRSGAPPENPEPDLGRVDTLQGALDSLKTSVDPEYQEVLEEYYRSLAQRKQK